MATRTGDNTSPAKLEATWVADEGKTISTVRVQQTCDAYVAVEHPANMSPEDLSAALGHRSAELSKCDWWGASKVTIVVEAVIGVNDPDSTYAEPIAITAADVAPPAPVAIVESFSEDA
jgi:hypothetical protein